MHQYYGKIRYPMQELPARWKIRERAVPMLAAREGLSSPTRGKPRLLFIPSNSVILSVFLQLEETVPDETPVEAQRKGKESKKQAEKTQRKNDRVHLEETEEPEEVHLHRQQDDNRDADEREPGRSSSPPPEPRKASGGSASSARHFTQGTSRTVGTARSRRASPSTTGRRTPTLEEWTRPVGSLPSTRVLRRTDWIERYVRWAHHPQDRWPAFHQSFQGPNFPRYTWWTHHPNSCDCPAFRRYSCRSNFRREANCAPGYRTKQRWPCHRSKRHHQQADRPDANCAPG